MNDRNYTPEGSWLTFIKQTKSGIWSGKVAIQKAMALYKCKCGAIGEYDITTVKNGKRKSCGCRIHKKQFKERSPKPKKQICCRCEINQRYNNKSYCVGCYKIVNRHSNSKRTNKVFNVDNLENEAWKDIPGFEGLYQASTLGRIKSLARSFYDKNKKLSNVPERIRSQKIDNGYYKLTLRKEGEYYTEWVHRLIALTFIPNPENKAQVNHKWGVKTDNRVSELEWVTYEEDREHCVKVLKHDWAKGIRYRGKDHVQSKKVKQINPKTNEVIKIWDSVSEAQKARVGYAISMCALGKLKTSGGFKWEYL